MVTHWITLTYTLHHLILALLFIQVLSEDCEIIHSGITLTCLGLTNFPDGSSYQGVETLNFHDNNFTELAPYIFEKHSFHNPKIVIIRQNNIRHIHPYAFADMLSIRELCLYGNNLIYLHDNTFNGLEGLKYLDLGHNKLKLVEGATFKSLKNLETLDLSYNNIQFITPYLLEQTSIAELYLSGNEFEFIHDDSILESDSLSVLTLQSCKLKTLHKNVFRSLPNLRYLDISYNQLELIPEGVLEPLKHLEQLDISNNGIFSLNANLFPLPSKLEALLCDKNPLDLSTKCENIIQQLQTVGGQLSESDSSSEIKSVQSTLDENQLTKGSISHLEHCIGKILVLSLHDNPFEDISIGSFNIISLVQLDRNYNELFELNTSVPSSFTKVTKPIFGNKRIRLDKERKTVLQKFEIDVRPKTSKHSINNTLSRQLQADGNEWLTEKLVGLPAQNILVTFYLMGVSGLVTMGTKKYQFLPM
ncbi:hypothetical protein ILUMI_06270 [Ignelater luminosus]|uniref:Chaoptin n=1 Tax=Ignelater luminosus TaxID=2038154 RepID=A0A8K0DAM3_IGNLU|nr:hypothetical protein ILUMI_06270 [Ignelater luminosus]